MKLYIDELAPWERKREYFEVIQLGKDVRTQSNLISKKTKEMISFHQKSVDSIITSQERISQGIDDVVYGQERIEDGIFELKAAFEWGISEVVWQIEQSREVFKKILEEILDVIKSPKGTKAKELRTRGEYAFANNLIDNAEKEFLDSADLNVYDFSVHISLGIIYLFKKIDKKKALIYFENAIKYAKPKSAFHTSFALLYKALILFDFGKIKEAESFSEEAIDLSPDFSEALYQNAQYNSKLGNIAKSISNLEKAIKLDHIYCLKVNNDKMFDPIRGDVNKLFEKLKKEEEEKALGSQSNLQNKIKNLDSIIARLSKEKIMDGIELTWPEKLENINNELKNLQSLIRRNSYFDFREINNSLIPKIENELKELQLDLNKSIETFMRVVEDVIPETKEKHKMSLSNLNKNLGYFLFMGSLIVPAILSILCFKDKDWDILTTILFVIPIVSQIKLIGRIQSYFKDINFMTLNEDLFIWINIAFFLLCLLIWVVLRIKKADKLKKKVSRIEDAGKSLKNYKAEVNEIEISWENQKESLSKNRYVLKLILPLISLLSLIFLAGFIIIKNNNAINIKDNILSYSEYQNTKEYTYPQNKEFRNLIKNSKLENHEADLKVMNFISCTIDIDDVLHSKITNPKANQLALFIKEFPNSKYIPAALLLLARIHWWSFLPGSINIESLIRIELIKNCYKKLYEISKNKSWNHTTELLYREIIKIKKESLKKRNNNSLKNHVDKLTSQLWEIIPGNKLQIWIESSGELD